MVTGGYGVEAEKTTSEMTWPPRRTGTPFAERGVTKEAQAWGKMMRVHWRSGEIQGEDDESALEKWRNPAGVS